MLKRSSKARRIERSDSEGCPEGSTLGEGRENISPVKRQEKTYISQSKLGTPEAKAAEAPSTRGGEGRETRRQGGAAAKSKTKVAMGGGKRKVRAGIRENMGRLAPRKGIAKDNYRDLGWID